MKRDDDKRCSFSFQLFISFEVKNALFEIKAAVVDGDDQYL